MRRKCVWKLFLQHHGRVLTPHQFIKFIKHNKVTAPKTCSKFLYFVNMCMSNFQEDLYSQGRCSGSILEEEPWQNFLSDLGPDKSILNEVNVASVKRKAAAKCFVGRKVPFLAAVLHHLDVSSPDPCIILRDSTGKNNLESTVKYTSHNVLVLF